MIFQRLQLALALAPAALQVSAMPCGGSGKALYLISNDAENQVVALPIGMDGKLAKGVSMATGGAGSNSIDGSTNQPAVPDALVSQSAVTVAGNSLFAVNAGSNTVSMFMIDETDPTKITMVGKPVAVPGEFPNTVAASAENNIVCVGMTGAVAGVSCASFSEQGIGAMDELRPFDLKQTTPPVGPTNTVSQVFFSDDEKSLYATVKGDPPKNNTGFLASFAVSSGSSCGGGSMAVSSNIMKSSPAGTAVLFGSAAIPGSSDIFVTDASFGAAVLSVEASTGTAMIKGQKGVIDGQAATCWATISPASKTAFVTDVAMNRLVEMSITDASIVGMIDLSANGDPGLIDLRAAGNFVYALSPGNGKTEAAITVVDVMTKKEVQHFKLGSLGVGANAMGMTVFEMMM